MRRKNKRQELTRLKGCEDCEKGNCKWNSNVATRDIAELSSIKYNCNTSRYDKI